MAILQTKGFFAAAEILGVARDVSFTPDGVLHIHGLVLNDAFEMLNKLSLGSLQTITPAAVAEAVTAGAAQPLTQPAPGPVAVKDQPAEIATSNGVTAPPAPTKTITPRKAPGRPPGTTKEPVKAVEAALQPEVAAATAPTAETEQVASPSASPVAAPATIAVVEPTNGEVTEDQVLAVVNDCRTVMDAVNALMSRFGFSLDQRDEMLAIFRKIAPRFNVVKKGKLTEAQLVERFDRTIVYLQNNPAAVEG